MTKKYMYEEIPFLKALEYIGIGEHHKLFVQSNDGGLERVGDQAIRIKNLKQTRFFIFTSEDVPSPFPTEK